MWQGSEDRGRHLRPAAHLAHSPTWHHPASGCFMYPGHTSQGGSAYCACMYFLGRPSYSEKYKHSPRLPHPGRNGVHISPPPPPVPRVAPCTGPLRPLCSRDPDNTVLFKGQAQAVLPKRVREHSLIRALDKGITVGQVTAPFVCKLGNAASLSMHLLHQMHLVGQNFQLRPNYRASLKQVDKREGGCIGSPRHLRTWFFQFPGWCPRRG